MNYWSLALVLSVAAFVVSSVVLSAALSLAHPLVSRQLDRLGPAARAAALWRLRLTPSAMAFLFAFGCVLPTFLALEPRDAHEPVPVTLAVLAIAGVTMLALAVLRGVRGWLATRRLERRWAATGTRWNGEAPLPVRVVSDSFPTVAVVGVVVPRLYIAERVVAACPPSELRAMIAHESAHVAARDNLKRFAMLLCPDLVWVRAALERAWVGAAEEAADAAAAGPSTERRLDLAEALLRVARLAPVATPPVAISAFYLGGSVDSRVRRLLDEDNEPAWRKSLDILFAIIAVPAVAALVISAPAVHTVIELLVRYLP